MAASELKRQEEEKAIEVENVLIDNLKANIKPNTPWSSLFNKCKKLLEEKLKSPMDRKARARFRQKVHLLNNLMAEHDSAFDHVNVAFARRLSRIMGEIESGLDSKSPTPSSKEKPLIESQTERVPSRGTPIKSHDLDVDLMAVENHLLCRRGPASGEFNAVGIYGAEGVGKSTLTQVIFHSEKVRSRFIPRIWISLSDNPASDNADVFVANVAKRILLQLRFDLETINQTNRDSLIHAIESELRGKRYLVVLDGASEETKYNETMMKMLRDSLPKGTEGAVMVTGRAKNVVMEMVGKDGLAIHRLLPLDKPVVCWEIYKTAAEDEDEMDADEKQKVKNEVVKRSGGLPWASTLLGIIRREIRGRGPDREKKLRACRETKKTAAEEEDEDKMEVKNEVVKRSDGLPCAST